MHDWTPRGVVTVPVADDPVPLCRSLPSADLAYWVECYWATRWRLHEQQGSLQQTLPPPAVSYAVEGDRAAIIGPLRGRYTRLLEGDGWAFVIKFRPGAFRCFLRAPLDRIARCPVSAASVFGDDAARYEADLRGAQDVPARVVLAEALLRRHLPPADRKVEQVNRIVEAIQADRGILRVEQLVGRFPLSLRSLQRLCGDYLGVSPKWIIHRYRLHEALDQLQHGRAVDWSALAADLGYFDQAHFSRDFSRMVGLSPTAYVRQMGHRTGVAGRRAAP